MFSYKQNERSPSKVIIGAVDGFNTSNFSSTLLMSHEKRVVNKIITRFKRVHSSPRYNATLQDQNKRTKKVIQEQGCIIAQAVIHWQRINYLITLLVKIKDLK